METAKACADCGILQSHYEAYGDGCIFEEGHFWFTIEIGETQKEGEN